VLDATYSRSLQRDAVRRFAEELGLRATLIEVRCDETTALERIERRMSDPDRISDAGLEVHRLQRERYEPPEEWPADASITLQTDRPDWRNDLRKRLEIHSREDTAR